MIDNKHIIFNNGNLYYRNEFICKFNREHLFDLKAQGIPTDFIISHVDDLIKKSKVFKIDQRKEKLKNIIYEKI
jgi:hypothetical protein